MDKLINIGSALLITSIAQHDSSYMYGCNDFLLRVTRVNIHSITQHSISSHSIQHEKLSSDYNMREFRSVFTNEE